MKKIIILVCLFIYVFSNINSESNNLKFRNINEKCNCPKENGMVELGVINKEGQKIILCGIKNSYSKSPMFSEVYVLKCDDFKKIFTTSEDDRYSFETKGDTLKLSYLTDWFFINLNDFVEDYKLFTYKIYLSQNELIIESNYNKGVIVRKEMLDKIKVDYTTFKLKDIENAKPAKKYQSPEKKIDLFIKKLMLASLNHDEKARNILINFEKKYGELLGSYGEIYLENISELETIEKEGNKVRRIPIQ